MTDDEAVRIEQTDRTKTMAGVIGLTAWFAVLGSLGRSVVSAGDAAGALWELVVFTGFFTIWTNTAVALALTVPLVFPQSGPGRFFRRSGVVTGLAASIALVALVYELLLRSGWDPLGVALLLDLLVHYLIPVAFVGYWWLVTPREGIRWSGPLVWLSYPAAYAGFVIVRGEIVGAYPYPFLDVAEYGYGTVLLNSLGIGAVFLAISLFFVGIGRLGKR